MRVTANLLFVNFSLILEIKDDLYQSNSRMEVSPLQGKVTCIYDTQSGKKIQKS